MSAKIIVGLGNGDEAKGTMVDFFSHRVDHLSHRAEAPITVVRFNGGGQAAHNVVLPDGTHHTFSMFGSGSFAGARTHLSRFVLVNLLAMANEALSLGQKLKADPFKLITIDLRCKVVTPWHIEANRAREESRAGYRHGSCGVGIGETMMDALNGHAIRMYDLLGSRKNVTRLLSQVHDNKLDEFPEMYGKCPTVGEVVDAYSEIIHRVKIIDDKTALQGIDELIFEGAQGVLIDEKHGFSPYHTWSNCTFDNALDVLRDIGYQGEVKKIGVLRSFAVRHGPGPFPTETTELKGAISTDHNTTNEWQGDFRAGWFDTVLSRYAIDACGGIDELAVTHLDRVQEGKICVARMGSRWTGHSYYEYLNKCDYLDTISGTLGVPVTYESHGPTWKDKVAFRIDGMWSSKVRNPRTRVRDGEGFPKLVTRAFRGLRDMKQGA